MKLAGQQLVGGRGRCICSRGQPSIRGEHACALLTGSEVFAVVEVLFA